MCFGWMARTMGAGRTGEKISVLHKWDCDDYFVRFKHPAIRLDDYSWIRFLVVALYGISFGWEMDLGVLESLLRDTGEDLVMSTCHGDIVF